MIFINIGKTENYKTTKIVNTNTLVTFSTNVYKQVR